MNGGLIGGYLDGWLFFGWVGLVGWWLIGSSFTWLGNLLVVCGVYFGTLPPKELGIVCFCRGV